MAQENSRRLFGILGVLQVAIIVLVLVTAAVHLQRGFSTSGNGFGGGGRPVFTGTPGAGGRRPGFTGTPGAGGRRSGFTGTPGAFPGGGARGGNGLGFNVLQWLPLPLSTLFILDGIGYIVLGVALYLPLLRRFQRIVRWLLIAFAAVTFVLYFLVNGFHLQTITIVDKAAEILLIVLLLLDVWQSRRSSGKNREVNAVRSVPVS